ncbi:MAG TPA: di-trans,poly-cis-decaprenylcistransferase [Candidatus Avidesulfovibrio excrementigallinarum]|nr:di-trans,poly-cis-decaprenylcistransferase [Candidatus Avidesulfovibrio excrementigallinarum]
MEQIVNELPQHIAIIMDGNGRWAQQRGLTRGDGHRAGVRAARQIVMACRERHIPFLTLYAFSRENWGRPRAEVSLLFSLLTQFLGDEVENMVANGIRLQVFGEVGTLPAPVRSALESALRRTAKGGEMTVNLAMNYSGREEILRAVRRIAASGINPGDITEETFRAHLYSAGQPDPDLVIRTSGERRLSNYLPFQTAYSELYFCETHWPDFTPAELDRALAWYAGRERRFGLTSDQLSEK